MIAFLFGTAIALALLVGVNTARQAHAAGPSVAVAATATSRSDCGSAEQCPTLQAVVRPAAADPTSGQTNGWVSYGAFALVVAVMVAIGTGLVPRLRF